MQIEVWMTMECVTGRIEVADQMLAKEWVSVCSGG